MLIESDNGGKIKTSPGPSESPVVTVPASSHPEQVSPALRLSASACSLSFGPSLSSGPS